MKTFKEILSEQYGANKELTQDELQLELVLNPDIHRICEAAEKFGDQFRQQWVSVGDSCPEYYKPFLAVCDNIVCIGMLYEVEYGGIATISVNGSHPILFTDAGFTHHMPLPTPPSHE